jgi:hypothetical protein
MVVVCHGYTLRKKKWEEGIWGERERENTCCLLVMKVLTMFCVVCCYKGQRGRGSLFLFFYVIKHVSSSTNSPNSGPFPPLLLVFVCVCANNTKKQNTNDEPMA